MKLRYWAYAAVLVILIVAVAFACWVGPQRQAGSGAGPTGPPSSSSQTTASLVPTQQTAVLIGAGDICRTAAIEDARQTAALIEDEPNALVFTLGDNSNEAGTAAQYQSCYGTTWGTFKGRTRPVPGNHDQLTSHGAAYYAYFGVAAGSPGKGYYSYDPAIGWHVIVLNAICTEAGGCGRGTPQEEWLRADLAANEGKDIIAMWHVPEFSSGGHGSTTTYITWWRDLYAAHADIVLDGHDHDYERFGPQSPSGEADENGIREFVVGTGGASHSPFFETRANSEVRNNTTFGVLQLTLLEHSYAWHFIPVEGGTFTDSGEASTHL